MTQDPLFLTFDEILELHAHQVAEFGGDAAILDLAKLESAIAQPAARFAEQYLHNSLASMASAYLFHIVQNHAFADGNKRTGIHAAIVFLELNGYSLEIPVDEAEQLVMKVATGVARKPEITSFFQNLMDDQYGTSITG